MADSKIEYAIIKNGFIGIQAETWPLDNSLDSSQNKLEISNTIIRNMAGIGMLLRNYNVVGENVVAANCGTYSAAISGGGNYTFKHCTFANYWPHEARNEPLLFISNRYDNLFGTETIKDLTKADFLNCIVYGNNDNELGFEKHVNGQFEYKFDHCLLKTEENTSDATRYINIVKNPASVTVDGETHDPVFNDFSENDYTLFDQSAAIDIGDENLTGTLTTDLKGDMRDNNPDLGAYEFIP